MSHEEGVYPDEERECSEVPESEKPMNILIVAVIAFSMRAYGFVMFGTSLMCMADLVAEDYRRDVCVGSFDLYTRAVVGLFFWFFFYYKPKMPKQKKKVN